MKIISHFLYGLIFFSTLLNAQSSILDGSSSNVGTVPTLTHDSNNSLYALYGDESLYQLKVMKRTTANTWTPIYTIAGSTNASKLSIDPQNHVHICYLKDNGIHYTTNKTGTWQSQRVDDAYASTWTRLGCVADANGSIHMSYNYKNGTENALHYASDASGQFIIEPLQSDNPQYSDLAVDSKGKPHIISGWSILDYNHKTDNQWQYTTIEQNGFWIGSAITIDHNDTLHIAFQKYSQLHYAQKKSTDSNFTRTLVDTNLSDGQILLDIASSNDGLSVTIGYILYNGTDQLLKQAILTTPNQWEIKTIENLGHENSWYGQYGVSIDMIATVPHMIYYDFINKDLRYDSALNCPQVITYAKVPQTSLWLSFGSPCDVPPVGLEGATQTLPAGAEVYVKENATIPSTQLNAEDISALNAGWHLLGTSYAITDFAPYQTTRTIWVYTNGIWKARSNDSTMNQLLNFSGYGGLNSIEKNRGFWIQK